MPLTDYQRGYRDAQLRSLELLQRAIDGDTAEVLMKIEMAAPVPGCGHGFQNPVDGTTHYCAQHEPDLFYVHSDSTLIWNSDGRYEDRVNHVIG